MYPHKKIEKKWQKYWEKNKTFEVTEDAEKKKQYTLDMFPYPSGEGLHVGHPEGYTANDIFTRYLRMNGYNVLHPIGYDAFGLPAENFAIKKGVHPNDTTQKNITRIREQLKSFGFSYGWSREVNTSSPEYYRWTQWLFLQLYRKGLAYKKSAPVNWCPSCQTVLANEQVIQGECERCHASVVQKNLEQWFFKVTTYAEELLSGLETIDWPSSIKISQKNWIGKSEGARITFQIVDVNEKIEIFTTRPDTLFGATYMVLAPEHPLIDTLKKGIINATEIEDYQKTTQKKNELERTSLEKEKTGVVLEGIYAINPATHKKIPVWIADYVLPTYATGAIMAVPAHDSRDFAFAKKYNLPIKMVVCPHYPASTCPILDEAYEGDGHLVESGSFTGTTNTESKKAIAEFVGGGTHIQYRLRDWLISRQRYWGAPIPIIYCETCGEQEVPEADLPVLLPTDVDFRPTGESPLSRSKTFHDVICPKCGKPARRESDTMDTFVCSSWYYLRYPSSQDEQNPFTKEKVSYWLPVDMYIGGAEHAVLHLLYSRFITKALRDAGFLSFDEPFNRLRNQGLILGEDGEKMSKSRGNVINPDDIVTAYGADTMRIYIMFMGPLEDAKPWNTASIMGSRRFLDKAWDIFIKTSEELENAETPETLKRILHKTIKKVTDDIVTFNFNTAISALMILLNAMHDTVKNGGSIGVQTKKTFLLLLSPFAPHIAEELWESLGHAETITYHPWPQYDSTLLVEDTTTLIIQINGKVRDSIMVPTGISEEEAKKLALSRDVIKKWIEGKEIKKIIFARGTLLNIVAQ